jgi:protein-S-isoprenylcysteine O-methyltransferase Ste14
MAGAAERGRGVTVVAARAVTPRWSPLRWRPPGIALALAVAAGAGHVALWGNSAPWGHAPVSGALLAAGGLVWMSWAWALFRAAGTPVRPSETPLQLIEEGPYRFGRNPMYLGIATLLLGAALGLGAPLLAVSALLFAALVNAVHIPDEEAQMARRFGGWWRDYVASTRRWL